MEHFGKLGEPPAVPLETKDLPEGTRFTDAEIREWLGAQASQFDASLKGKLHLLEVYAGEARATAAVRELGGTAIAPGSSARSRLSSSAGSSTCQSFASSPQT